MSYILNSNKSECTGCKACEQICPKKCITFIEDEEGFYYPQKSTECIKCGRCEKVCPMNNKTENKIKEQDVYVAKIKDEKELLKSSSGGMFWAIVDEYCDKNFAIFGARYDEKFNVIHDYTCDFKQASIFRKSKYVQSNIKNNYIIAEQFLKEGKKVFFTGTPCQVDGLKKYLGKTYENLLTVDLICHGVPSQKVFNKYIEYVERKYKSKISNLNFREKTLKEGNWNSRNIKIELENGETIIEDSTKNLFLKGFHKALFYRPSCKECKYANPNRVSDITIGDCWGIEEINDKRNTHKGESLIILNTKKGKEIFNNLKEKLDYERLTLEFAMRTNAQLKNPTKFHKNREKFFYNLDKTEFDILINKYTKKDKLIIRIIKKINNIVTRKDIV